MLIPWIVRYMCTLNTNVHIINTLKEYKVMIMNKLVFQTNTPVWIPGESKLRPLHWNHNAAGTSISFKNTPFQIGYKRDLDCQYGNHYYKNKQESSKGSTKDAKDKKLPRLRTQGTRKQGCRACIHIREYVLFSEYSIEDDITKNMSKWKLRQLKEEKIRILRNDIEKGIAKSVRKYYVSLPSAEAHHTTHPTGGVYGMAQKVHPKLLEKIHQLVSEGVTVVSEMKRALNHYVKYELCHDSLPDPNDRAYHPTNNDIKNHIYRAKSKLQLSKFDQENLSLKINEWQKKNT